ncbi:MAG: acyltransferase [Prevotella sp.]|nr:acyltransferase [Prevotella sp.]
MNRIAYLDGLKGFAALCVLIHHFYMVFYGVVPDDVKVIEHIPFINMLVNGQFAVCIFIIISNYIFAKTINAHLDIISIQRRITKRYFRLVIPIVFIVAIVAIMYYAGMFHLTELNDSKLDKFWKGLTATDFIKQVFLSPFGYSKVIGPFWMLKYIFLGNLFVALITIMVNGRSLSSKVIIYLLAALLSINFSKYWVCAFVGGLIHEIRTNRKKQLGGALCVGIGIGALIISQTTTAMQPSVFSENKWVCIISATLFFYGILCLERIQSLLSKRAFGFLGENSLSIYLVHWPVVCSLSCLLFLQVLGDNWMYLTANLLITITVVLLLSYLYTKYVNKYSEVIVEKIMNRLK